MPTVVAYELRDFTTKRPLSRHSSPEGARLGALFVVKNGDEIYWSDDHGLVDGEIRFEIVRVEYKENPNQTFR